MLAFYHFPTKKTFFGFVTQLFARIRSQIQVKLSVLKNALPLFFRMAQRNASSSRHLHALCCASRVLHSCLICRIVYGCVEEGLHSDVFTSHSYYFTYCVVIFAKVSLGRLERCFQTRVGALTPFTCAEGTAIIQSWNESGWKAYENLRC